MRQQSERALAFAAAAYGLPLALWPDYVTTALLADQRPAETPPQAMGSLAEHVQLALAREKATARRQGNVAVMSIRGPLFAKRNIYEVYGFGMSYETIGGVMRGLAADDSIKAIIMDVDSPGGTASGCPECADLIRGLRGSKPIVAHADHLAASAAYWLASSADEIIASPSALVGSVGCYMLHLDFSGMLAELGIKPTFIQEGQFKTDGNPYEPLTDTARETFQELCRQCMDQFVASVAAGRGVSAATVRKDYGQGKVLTAKDAKAAGMIDKVRTIEETIAAYGGAAATTVAAGGGGAEGRAEVASDARFSRRRGEIALSTLRQGMR